jgi:hypothetical protein
LAGASEGVDQLVAAPLGVDSQGIGLEGLPNRSTLLRRPDRLDAEIREPHSGTFPSELEAWRDARTRSRLEPAIEDWAPSQPLAMSMGDTTLPSPLSAHRRPNAGAGITPTDEATPGVAAAQPVSVGKHQAPAPASGAPVEPLVGSPVDFVLSDMGQWPRGVDERERQEPEPRRAAAADAPVESAPSFVAAAQRRAFWASRPVRFSLWSGALLLALALALQVALSRRSWIAAHAPALVPAMSTVCQLLGCTIAPYRDIDAIVIDSYSFNRSGSSSFQFSVTLRNQSDVPVATPALELTLYDATDQTVVRRVVATNELNAPQTLGGRGEFSATSSLVLTDAENASAITRFFLVAFYP